MVVGALLLGAILETLGVGPRPLACTFPGTTPTEPAIELVMTARPSLKDIPGLYRVEMAVDGRVRLQASAQPIVSTEGQDVLVRAKRGRNMHYTVGIDAEGRAALNVLIERAAGANPKESLRKGHCRNYQGYIERWSAL